MDPWLERLKGKAFRKEIAKHCGETALHEACYSGCSLQAMKEILFMHPEAVLVKDLNGRTPLHWALASKPQHLKARELLSFCIRHLRITSISMVRYDDDGVVEARSESIIKSLLLAKNSLGYTPLDHACCSDVPSDIVRDLLELSPEASREKKNGKTPLHMLIEYCHYKGIPIKTKSLDLLLSVYPKAARMVDRSGNTPLHHAGYPKANVVAFKKLLNASRHVTSYSNELGRTPLHCACIANAPVTIIDPLLDADPLSVSVTDNDGNTPLHLACMYKTDPLVVGRLIDCYNGEYCLGSINERSLTPLQLCKNLTQIYEVIRVVPHLFQEQPKEYIYLI